MKMDFLPILKNMPGHLYWKDVQGIYLGCNKRLARAAGFAREQDIMGKTDFDLPWQQQAATIQANEQQVIRSGIGVVQEEKRKIADGSELVFLTNIVPMYDENQKITGLIGMALDITEYKNSEKDLDKKIQASQRQDHEKTQLLVSVSHELRTPLVGILSMLRAFDKLLLPLQAQEYLQDIKISTEHMLSLTHDLLDNAKMAEGKMQLLKSPFHLRELLLQIHAMMLHHARLKSLQLIYEIKDEVPSLVVGDERAIKQILINLMSNAIKFTLQGEVLLQVSLVKKSPQGVEIALSVRDTGVGIPEDKQVAIFDRFAHADPLLAREQGGSGLGLSLCQQYLVLMGGHITVKSEVGYGSQFTCVIPFSLPSDEKMNMAEEAAVSVPVGEEVPRNFVKPHFLSAQAEQLIRVLLVEDNLIIQKAHTLLLQEMGCWVDVVDRGELALSRISQGENYDMIFMDIGLPGITGIEVVKQIREWELMQMRFSLPIIAMTAYLNAEEHERCLDAGMDAVITKPIQMNELRCVIMSFLPPQQHVH